ncbi:MAG: DUF1269 domain-containing protein [Deltaproteobacteria bacterium]|nr:DUF1269 domain-containing protein [Deltaproteobacteria bacterium]
MALKLGVVIFDDADRAGEVLTGYRELHPSDEWAENVGVIERRKSGRIAMYGALGSDVNWEEEGVEPLLGVSVGGMTGLLLGALAGPPGIAIGGAAGAAMGGLLGGVDEETVNGTMFDIIRGKLAKNSSALALLADDRHVDDLLSSTRRGAREVYEQPIRDELKGRLEEALREAAQKPMASSTGAGLHEKAP